MEQQFYSKFINKSKIFLKPDMMKIKNIFDKQKEKISILRKDDQ